MKIILTSAIDMTRFMVDTKNIIGAVETAFGSEVSIVKRGVGFDAGNDKVDNLNVLNSIDFLTASINHDSDLMMYEVRHNDTLSEISLNLEVSVDYLKILNNIISDKIRPGQVIYY